MSHICLLFRCGLFVALGRSFLSFVVFFRVFVFHDDYIIVALFCVLVELSRSIVSSSFSRVSSLCLWCTLMVVSWTYPVWVVFLCLTSRSGVVVDLCFGGGIRQACPEFQPGGTSQSHPIQSNPTQSDPSPFHTHPIQSSPRQSNAASRPKAVT